MTIFLLSCNQNDDLTSTDNNSFSPDNIVGKIIILDGGTFKFSEFTTSGNCSVSTNITITGTPTYKYSKIDSKSADFSCSFITGSSNSYSWIYMHHNPEITLNFNNANSGTYSLFDTIVTSNQWNSSTSFSSSKGTFTIN